MTNNPYELGSYSAHVHELLGMEPNILLENSEKIHTMAETIRATNPSNHAGFDATDVVRGDAMYLKLDEFVTYLERQEGRASRKYQ